MNSMSVKQRGQMEAWNSAESVAGSRADRHLPVDKPNQPSRLGPSGAGM